MTRTQRERRVALSEAAPWRSKSMDTFGAYGHAVSGMEKQLTSALDDVSVEFRLHRNKCELFFELQAKEKRGLLHWLLHCVICSLLGRQVK